jgi:hypothetical protein
MEKDNQDDFESEQKKTTSRGPNLGLLIPIVLIAVLVGAWILRAGPATTQITYSFFLEQLKAKNVTEVQLKGDSAVGRFREPPLLPVPPPTAAEEAAQKTGKSKAKAAEPVRAKEYFTVTLSAWQKDNSELSEALSASGAVYDNASQPIEPGVMVSLIVMGVMVGLFVLFWLWLRRQQN